MPIRIDVPRYVKARERLGYKQAMTVLQTGKPPPPGVTFPGYFKWHKFLQERGTGVQVLGEGMEPLVTTTDPAQRGYMGAVYIPPEEVTKPREFPLPEDRGKITSAFLGVTPPPPEFLRGTEVKEEFPIEPPWKPGWWERTPLREHVKGEIMQLGEAGEYYLGGAGLLEYKPSLVPPLLPTVPEAPPGSPAGTAIFRPPTKEEMTPEQRLEKDVFEIQTESHLTARDVVPKLQEKYQEKISSGELTVDQARRRMAAEYKKEMQPYERRYAQARIKYEKGLLRATYPLTFARGMVFGGVSAIAPPVALTLAGVGVAETAFRSGELSRLLKLHQKETLTHLGLGLTGIAAGRFVTVKGVTGIRGFLERIGKQRIATEKLIQRDVLAGKKLFPIAPKKKHLRLFEEQRFKLPSEKALGVWKAVEAKWVKKTTTRIGKYELPGASVAPSISPHFLRVIGKKYGLIGISMKSVLEETPAALRIYIRGFKDIGKMPLKAKYKFLMRARKGYAYVPKIKAEIEAIIPPSTKLLRIAKKYYFDYKDVSIPIHQYKVLDLKDISRVGKVGKDVTTVSKLISKYSYKKLPKTYLITPSALAYSLRVSRPRYKPYKPYVPPKLKLYEIKEYVRKLDYKIPSYKYKAPKLYKPYRYKALRYGLLYYPPKRKKKPPIPVTFPFEEELIKKKRRRLKKFRVKEPVLYTPGFLERALRIKAAISPAQLRKMTSMPSMAIGLRPMIVRKKKKKKRRR